MPSAQRCVGKVQGSQSSCPRRESGHLTHPGHTPRTAHCRPGVGDEFFLEGGVFTGGGDEAGLQQGEIRGKESHRLRNKGDFMKEMGSALCCAGGIGFADTEGKAGSGHSL